MKSRASTTSIWVFACLALAGCAAGPVGQAAPIGGAASGSMVADLPVMIGAPYTIGGRTYTPADTAHYDEVGYASFYGEGLGGRPTARGEAFRPEGISAAHRTLPLPSYVEVTSLDTGETILVRINDRGPFDQGRIIDLSVGAARALGIEQQGVAPVRVRRVYPAEGDKERLRAGLLAPARLTSSDQLLEALRARLADGGGMIPAATPPPDGVEALETVAGSTPASPRSAPAVSAPAAGGEYYVQLGAFSNEGNARRLADRAQPLGPVSVTQGERLRRVRLGPFADSRAAESALARARQAGFADARIFREPSR